VGEGKGPVGCWEKGPGFRDMYESCGYEKLRRSSRIDISGSS
jgi:hypothetical protein